MQAVSLLAVLVGIVAVWALLARWPVRIDTRRAAAAAFAGLWCVVLVLMQHHYFPIAPAIDRNMPAAAADYRTQLSAGGGDAMLIGDPEPAAVKNPSVARDTLIAASWYLNPHPMQSTYTTISFRPYAERFCIHYNGSTCPQAITRLFEREPTTGERWADLLSVSTLLVFRPDFAHGGRPALPSGWERASRSRWTDTWTRTDPLPTAGGVVWASPGVEVSESANDDRHLRLRVSDVPAGGGTVVLSRLDWPGYRVTGAQLGDPLADTLVTLKIPEQATDREVSLTYAPPGWRFELGALALAIAIIVLWSAGAAVRVPARRRRARFEGPQPQ
jgi:hypothetical protein